MADPESIDFFALFRPDHSRRRSWELARRVRLALGIVEPNQTDLDVLTAFGTWTAEKIKHDPGAVEWATFDRFVLDVLETADTLGVIPSDEHRG